GIGRYLPAREVDRLEPRLDLLHRLVAGEGAEGRNERFAVQQLPELAGAILCEAMPHRNAAGEPSDILRTIVSHDVPPAIGSPFRRWERIRTGWYRVVLIHFSLLLLM